jgi:hypothetical protein
MHSQRSMRGGLQATGWAGIIRRLMAPHGIHMAMPKAPPGSVGA